MSNILLFLIILLTTLSILAAVLLVYLRLALKKRIRRISDIIYRSLVAEITFYTNIDAMKGELLEEECVSEGTWYWFFAYDSVGGFGCYMPMNDLFATPDFSEVLNNVERSYLVGITENGKLESYTPTDLIRDWYGRK